MPVMPGFNIIGAVVATTIKEAAARIEVLTGYQIAMSSRLSDALMASRNASAPGCAHPGRSEAPPTCASRGSKWYVRCNQGVGAKRVAPLNKLARNSNDAFQPSSWEFRVRARGCTNADFWRGSYEKLLAHQSGRFSTLAHQFPPSGADGYHLRVVAAGHLRRNDDAHRAPPRRRSTGDTGRTATHKGRTEVIRILAITAPVSMSGGCGNIDNRGSNNTLADRRHRYESYEYPSYTASSNALSRFNADGTMQ
jgi:hypothetical protein